MDNPQDNRQGPEGRKFPRLTTDIDVVYVKADQADIEKINKIKDISEGGVCIIAYDDIPEGTILAIKIYLPETNGPLEIKGKVVWKSKFSFDSLERPRYDIGVQFINIPQAYRDLILSHAFVSPKRKMSQARDSF